MLWFPGLGVQPFPGRSRARGSPGARGTPRPVAPLPEEVAAGSSPAPGWGSPGSPPSQACAFGAPHHLSHHGWRHRCSPPLPHRAALLLQHPPSLLSRAESPQHPRPAAPEPTSSDTSSHPASARDPQQRSRLRTAPLQETTSARANRHGEIRATPLTPTAS